MTQGLISLVRRPDLAEGDIQLQWRIDVLDDDNRALTAGPAGWATVALPAGVAVTVDYLDPSRLLAVQVDVGKVSYDQKSSAELPPVDTTTRAIVAALLGDAAAAAVTSQEFLDSTVELELSSHTAAAGRLALLTTYAERTRRSLDSLYAIEAAVLVTRIDDAMADWARHLAERGVAALAVLPTDRVRELFGATHGSLELLARAGARLTTSASFGSLLAALDASVNTAFGELVSDDRFTDSVLPTSTGDLDDQPFAMPAVRAFDEPSSESTRGAALVDPIDERPGLFVRAAEFTDDGQQIEVRMELSEPAAMLPPAFLGGMRVVARSGSGKVLDRSGFRVEARRAVAVLRRTSFPQASGLWFDVTSAPRGTAVTQQVRSIQRAVAAGQRAADLERAAQTVSEDSREQLLLAVEEAWWEASARWSDANNPRQVDAANDRAEAASRGESPTTEPFDVERLAPAITYWLGDLETGQVAEDDVASIAALSRCVGADRARVEFDMERARRGTFGVSVDLDETLWSALATRDPDLVERATVVWSAHNEWED